MFFQRHREFEDVPRLLSDLQVNGQILTLEASVFCLLQLRITSLRRRLRHNPPHVSDEEDGNEDEEDSQGPDGGDEGAINPDVHIKQSSELQVEGSVSSGMAPELSGENEVVLPTEDMLFSSGRASGLKEEDVDTAAFDLALEQVEADKITLPSS